MFTCFQVLFLFQNSKTKLNRLHTSNSPRMMHAHPSVHCSDVKVLPFQPSYSHSKVSLEIIGLPVWPHTKKVKIHKLSKTFIDLFMFYRLLRPWKRQIISPKLPKTVGTLLRRGGGGDGCSSRNRSNSSSNSSSRSSIRSESDRIAAMYSSAFRKRKPLIMITI